MDHLWHLAIYFNAYFTFAAHVLDFVWRKQTCNPRFIFNINQAYIRISRGNAFKHQNWFWLNPLVKAQKIQFYATEPFTEDQFIHCQNTIFLIHVNTDNDNSFSLFDCLLNVLILTFSVCGISYYRWILLTGFHSIFIICHVYCSINKHSWADWFTTCLYVINFLRS